MNSQREKLNVLKPAVICKTIVYPIGNLVLLFFQFIIVLKWAYQRKMLAR